MINDDQDQYRGVARHVSRLPGNPPEVGVTYNANVVTRAEHVLYTILSFVITAMNSKRQLTLASFVTRQTGLSASYLRSTMRQDRLSSLALLHINYTMVIDVDEVIDMFARKHPRKMILRNIIG